MRDISHHVAYVLVLLILIRGVLCRRLTLPPLPREVSAIQCLSVRIAGLLIIHHIVLFPDTLQSSIRHHGYRPCVTEPWCSPLHSFVARYFPNAPNANAGAQFWGGTLF
ncbi:hypothetical protein BJV78DRAFT_855665 [Lactifluus subvellereus]|nr:hypothetical protein BJV78DRAFT_855665 [Lactifluus subvellereus]